MAGVVSASAPPQAPPPPPSTAAPASALRAEDLVVVAAAFVVGVFGFAWLSSAANAAFIAAEWGYGRGSIQAAFAKDIALAASVLLGIFLHALVLVIVILTLFWREESRRTETPEVIGGHGGGAAAQQPARVQENRIPCGVVLSLVALLMIIVLAVLMHVTSWWAKGARDVGAGYLLVDTVFFLCSVIFCLVTAPLLIIRLVVATRRERSQTAGSN